MHTRALLILLCLSFNISYLEAQTVSKEALGKLQLKSGYLLMGGTISVAAGAIMTGFGVHNFQMGTYWGGTIGNPELVDDRPAGRKLISVGVPLLAGGLAMLSCGIYFRVCYLDKKKSIVLKTGYFSNGRFGAAMKF